MFQADLIVRNGTLVSGLGRREADIAIAGGRFAAIEERGRLDASADEEVDAGGHFVLPGLIDGHVHFREPGLTHEEDWATGSRAAVMGGITTVLDMPNTVPPTDRVPAARLKAGLAAQKSYCDFGLFGLVGPDNGEEIVPLAQSGLVVGFKVFLGQTTGSIGAPAPHDLARAMVALAGLGFRVGAHAEDRGTVERETARLRANGRTDGSAHLESRPPSAEVEAVGAFGRLARNSRCPVHVFHLSSADGLAAVQAERAAGAEMTCEVSAHHCFLSADDANPGAGLAKTNPPVRGPEHGAPLLAALAEGRIDIIASDHAPHQPESKNAASIWDVLPGIAGVETTLPLFLTRAIAPGTFSMERLVQAMAEGPARTWGLWPAKGSITVGADADLTIVDPAQEGTIRGANLHSLHGLTPFEGWTTRGAAVATIVRGRLVMSRGRLVGRPGWGRLVERRTMDR